MQGKRRIFVFLVDESRKAHRVWQKFMMDILAEVFARLKNDAEMRVSNGRPAC
jgi:hypothetical protein